MYGKSQEYRRGSGRHEHLLSPDARLVDVLERVLHSARLRRSLSLRTNPIARNSQSDSAYDVPHHEPVMVPLRDPYDFRIERALH